MLAMPNCTWLNPRAWHVPPYTLGLLRAVIPEDRYDIEILDTNLENLSIEETTRRIKDFRPDLVAVCSMSHEYARSAHKLIEIIKKTDRNIITLMGGVYCTVTPELAMDDKYLDFVILGEGEKRLPEFLERINKKIRNFSGFDGIAYRQNGKLILNPIKTHIEDLDSLPFPAYEEVHFSAFSKKSDKFSNVLLPRYYPYAITSTSRGCPFSCIYCSTHSIDGNKIRYKSSERVLEEIDWLVHDYGIKEIIFLDDNLILNRSRFVRILKGLIERNYDLHWKSVNLTTFKLDEKLLEMMKKSKAYQVILPIESGNQHVLSKILKKPLNLKRAKEIANKAKSLELETAADFIIGIPGETWDQIRETVRFAEDIDVDMVSFHIATPLPKTEMYEIAKNRGALEKDFDFKNLSLFGFAKGHITTDEFKPEVLHMLRALEWDRINFKTPEKKKRFARMAGITLKELEMWRKKTLENVGIYFPKISSP